MDWRMKLLKIGSLVILLVTFLAPVRAEHQSFTVSGQIYTNRIKPVILYLVDEQTARVPLTGVASLEIHPTARDVENGYIRFQFKDIPEGRYGIRCFQDLNANGKLDKGLFGPAEPWGFSWKNQKPSQWPDFSHYAFDLTTDLRDIHIHLEK